MFNKTFFSLTELTTFNFSDFIIPSFWDEQNWQKQNRQIHRVFWASVFLISVPVFIEAPLVRQYPEISLLLTSAWILLSVYLWQRPQTQIWGDLLLGFSWIWLAGSIYWGWLRWEPILHLPVEAIAVPIAIWSLWQGRGVIGSMFYLGSLLGTILTDTYFYFVHLMPYWRQVMSVEPALAAPILKNAVADIQTPWGICCTIVLACLLLTVGVSALQKKQIYWWAFSGAVLSTILVDGLFGLAAFIA